MAFTPLGIGRAWDWGGLTARELAKRTFVQMLRHETIDRAAIVAFYALLSLAPFLSLVIAVAIGRGGLAGELLAVSSQLLPPEGHAVILGQVEKIQTTAPAAVLSLSFVILLWSSSSSFVAVMDAINAAYGSRDQRPWWRRRLMAVLLMVVESALLIAALVAILAWPHVVAWIAPGQTSVILAMLVQWLVVIVLLLASFSLAYYFGTEAKQSWAWVTPGGTLGVVALIAATLGFRLYLRYGFSLSETYGTLAGVIVLLLWLYNAALALLVGAEINSVIEQAGGPAEPPPE